MIVVGFEVVAGADATLIAKSQSRNHYDLDGSREHKETEHTECKCEVRLLDSVDLAVLVD